MTMDQTGMSSSEGKFICANKSLIFLICFVIWINFHHKPGRVGTAELQNCNPFPSWLDGKRKEGSGSSVHRYLMIPFHWKAIHILHTLSSLVAKIRELYPEADGNYMGFKRKRLDVKMSWDCSYHNWNTSIWLNYIHAWIPTVAPMKELMDSHSSSDEGIGGFPQ